MSKQVLQFMPDAGLMYLIQQVTKKPTDEILGFFYDLGKEIFSIGIDNMSGRSIRKDVQDIYPNTAIPFKILVKAHKHRYDDRITGTIEVMFPDNPTYMNTDKLIEAILESNLLGADSPLPDFDAPKSKTPSLYKDLIAQVVKGKKEDV